MSKDKFATVACPACQSALLYKKSIKIHAELADGAKVVDVPLVHKEGFEEFSRSAYFACPRCNQTLQLEIEVKVIRAVAIEYRSDIELLALEGSLTEEQAQQLKALERNGLLAVFGEVVKRLSENGERSMPKSIPMFFLSFLRSTVEMRLAPPVVSQLREVFKGRIGAYKAQGIAMITSEGVIRAFMATKTMSLDMQARKSVKLRGVNIDRGYETLDTWKRTGYGYVPPCAQIFLESLLHSLGDRGREMRDVRLRSE